MNQLKGVLVVIVVFVLLYFFGWYLERIVDTPSTKSTTETLSVKNGGLATFPVFVDEYYSKGIHYKVFRYGESIFVVNFTRDSLDGINPKWWLE